MHAAAAETDVRVGLRLKSSRSGCSNAAVSKLPDE